MDPRRSPDVLVQSTPLPDTVFPYSPISSVGHAASRQDSSRRSGKDSGNNIITAKSKQNTKEIKSPGSPMRPSITKENSLKRSTSVGREAPASGTGLGPGMQKGAFKDGGSGAGIPGGSLRRLSSGREKEPAVGGKSPVPQAPSSTERLVTRRRSMTTAGRDGRPIAGPDLRGQDDTRLDLRAQMIRSLNSELVYLTAKLEFVYLRDNKLSSLDGIEVLKKVKVLDVSFNELKGASLSPLSSCKALQQLYLAGNHLTTLEDLPKLPNLEFLSVAQNDIRSLSMASQPKLQVLAASKNKISTLKGFPLLPSLEHLRVEENPVLELPFVEAAAVILVGPTLSRFNDQDISDADIEIARQYPGHSAMCIQEGWQICAKDGAEESMLLFLRGLWKPLIPQGYSLRKARIGHPQEEEPCQCEVELVPEWGKPGDSLRLKYQWLKSGKGALNFTPIEEATGQDYWPRYADVGYFLKVECIPLIPGQELPPLVMVTSPVLRGSGQPRIVGIKVTGETMEGAVLRGSADVAWCSGNPGKSLVGWWRCQEGHQPVPIKQSDGLLEYKLTLDDVGARIEFGYTPVTAEGNRGEGLRASTHVIRPAPPKIVDVEIVGDPVIGHMLTGSGNYYGGREGLSRVEWLREHPTSGKLTSVGSLSLAYIVQPEDVGSRLVFQYTPVSSEGLVGSTVLVYSAKILLAAPRVSDLVIQGDLVEGGTLSVTAKYSGGEEGPSVIQWFKSRNPTVVNTADLDVLPTRGHSKELVVPLEAVGYHVVVKYTPVRSDGETGKALVAVTPGTAQMLPPMVMSMSMSGEMLEGGTLVAGYAYFGGYEGKSQYGWHRHKTAKDPGIAIKDAQQVLKYVPRLEDVGHIISFQCLPLRSDGALGESKAVMGNATVEAGPPRITSLRIVGEPTEGSVVRAVKEYRGGVEGNSTLQWHLTRPDGAKETINAASGGEYTVRSHDLDGLLSLSCLPVRADGVVGPVAVSPLVGPVTAASPRCVALSISGRMVEGERLEGIATYRGGEMGICVYKWYRRMQDGLSILKTDRPFVVLGADDVGCQMLLEYTPVRVDGIAGETSNTLSDSIEPGYPTAMELHLPERCEEDVPVDVSRRYSGGQEGEGKWGWYRSSSPVVNPEDLSLLRRVAYTRTYLPSLEDVGNFLVLEWIPERSDGKVGLPRVASSPQPVSPGWPVAKNVTVKKLSYTLFEGSAEYRGGREGKSICTWLRRLETGELEEIEGANTLTYCPCDKDYGCRLVFGYLPKRSDGVVGTQVMSQPSEIVYPELPSRHAVNIEGTAAEGETIKAVDIIDEPWKEYKRDVSFQWSRAGVKNGEYEVLTLQRESQYIVTLEDVGCYLRCSCLISDIFDRKASQVECTTTKVAPGKPHVDDLSVDGRGFHTSLFTVKGTYGGGKEGKSEIQWFRMKGQESVLISGETARTYEACADDVDCILMVQYTPVREDGIKGEPATASTPVVAMEPDVATEVENIVKLGSAKFETQQPVAASALERRVVDVNRKRVKVVKPGSRTSFSSTEVKGSYDPPFRVDITRSEPFHLKIIMAKDHEVELGMNSRHQRDIVALAIRQLAKQYQESPTKT